MITLHFWLFGKDVICSGMVKQNFGELYQMLEPSFWDQRDLRTTFIKQFVATIRSHHDTRWYLNTSTRSDCYEEQIGTLRENLAPKLGVESKYWSLREERRKKQH
jgi:hypothetical protein